MTRYYYHATISLVRDVDSILLKLWMKAINYLRKMVLETSEDKIHLPKINDHIHRPVKNKIKQNPTPAVKFSVKML